MSYPQFMAGVLLIGSTFLLGLAVGLYNAPLYKSNNPMTSEHDMVYSICDRSYTVRDGVYEDTCAGLQDITGIEYVREEMK